MEGLIVLAVVFFVIRQLVRVAKQAERSRGDEHKPVAPPVAAPSPWGQIAEMMGETADVPGEGEGWSDERGCIGGSIAHEAHEGVTRDGMLPSYAFAEGYGAGDLTNAPSEGRHAPGSLAYTPETKYHPVVFGGIEQAAPRAPRVRITRAAARGAVVMAELLARPVALRGDD